MLIILFLLLNFSFWYWTCL